MAKKRLDKKSQKWNIEKTLVFPFQMARAENTNFTKSHFFDHFAYAILWSIFGGVLGAFWPPFGRHFGIILRAFSVEEAPRSEKHDFSKTICFPMVFSCFFSSARSKNRCESYNSGIMRRSRFLHRFLMPKVTKKELILAQFSLQNEVKNRSKIEVGQKGPKRGQKGPQPSLTIITFGQNGPWGRIN